VIVAACENMISDKAYRPGDILTASNGKVRCMLCCLLLCWPVRTTWREQCAVLCCLF
jgi:hypothetical protein